MDLEAYNRSSFPLHMDDPVFAAFRQRVLVGTPAPDGDLVDAATGATRRLSELWNPGVIVEFGSFT